MVGKLVLLVCALLFAVQPSFAQKDKIKLGKLTIEDSFPNGNQYPDGVGFVGVGARSDGNSTYQDQRLAAASNPCVTITVNNTGLFWADLDESPSPDGATGYDCVNGTLPSGVRAFRLTLPNPGPGTNRSPCKILCTSGNCVNKDSLGFDPLLDASCVLTLASLPGLPERNVNPRLRVDGLFSRKSPAQGFGFLFRTYEGGNLKASYTITSEDRVQFVLPGGNSNKREVAYAGNAVVNLVAGPTDSGPVSDPFPFYFKFTAEQQP